MDIYPEKLVYEFHLSLIEGFIIIKKEPSCFKNGASL